MKRRSAKGTRRISAVLCVFCMFVFLFAGTYNVQAQNTAGIVTNLSYSGNEETGRILKVSFALTGNEGLWGLKFKADYDSYAMTLKSMEVGNVFAEDEVSLSENAEREEILFVGTRNQIENYTGNGVLLSLNFSVDSKVSFRDYPVAVDVIQAIDVDGEDVKLDVICGKVRGDVNADNNVTLDDATMVLKAALGIEDLEDKATGDVNRDGKVTLDDANVVLRLALGIAVED